MPATSAATYRCPSKGATAQADAGAGEKERTGLTVNAIESVPGTNQRFMVHTDKKSYYKLLTTRKIDNELTTPEQRIDEYNIEIKGAH